MDMMLPVGVGGCLPAASGGLLPVSDTAGLVSTSPVDAQTNETHDSPIKNEEDAPESVPVQEAPSEKITYRIPSYAEWFSSDKIHFIERRALPEFFDGKSLSRTPKVYKESRDFIINKYKEQPERALTYTEIRKMLVGDVNLIRKIFDYVEYWGLINFHTANENKQKEIGTESGAVQFPTETIPSGIRIVYPSKILRAKAQKPSKEGPSGIINMPSYMDIFTNSNLLNVTGSELTAITGSQICSNCGIDNQSKWFENREKEGSILCEACFTAGDKFLKEDFTLVESVGGSKRNSVWTKEEVLSLLEAIATHGNNWDDVASKVGTKSKAECIMYFMKLPFGDQFCNGNVEPDSLITSRSTTDSLKIDQRNTNNNVEFVGVHDNEELLESVEDAEGPPNKARRLNPLADSSHPILDQVAFLSAMVGPRVAAAAAHASLLAISEEDPVAAQFLSAAQPSQKESIQITSTSKDNSKMNEEQKEETGSRNEQNSQPLRAVDADTTSTKDHLPSTTQIRAAIATALGAVAGNAKLLADQEERETEHLMAIILENQLKKLDSKVQHFEELEHLLNVEHVYVERTQTYILADSIRFSNFNYTSRRG